MQIDVGGLVFDTVVQGDEGAEVVLLLHGFPQSSWCWRSVTPLLVEAGYRVVAPDQRGYSPGARPEGAAAYAMSELVGDALGILDALGVERAHVVGHDWGAAVAWQLGGRHPERVRTLTTLCVPHPVPFTQALMTDPDQQRRSRYMLDFQQVGTAEQALLADDGAYFRSFFAGAEDVADVDRYLAEMREPGRLTAALNWYRAASRASVDGFPPVTVPTTYVWADGDLALGRTAAEATAAHVDGPYRFVELAGVTHWVPEQVPDRLAAVVLEQLRG